MISYYIVDIRNTLSTLKRVLTEMNKRMLIEYNYCEYIKNLLSDIIRQGKTEYQYSQSVTFLLSHGGFTEQEALYIDNLMFNTLIEDLTKNLSDLFFDQKSITLVRFSGMDRIVLSINLD